MIEDDDPRKTAAGENLLLEWEHEPDADILWDALELVKTDPKEAIETIEGLAKKGSSLSMMYLGGFHGFGRHGMERDDKLAKSWWGKAASLGSIEGAFSLARRLHIEGDYKLAEAEYRKLAELRFSPALYVFGVQHYHGEWLEKDLQKSIEFFEEAEREGHLWATHFLCHIFRKEKLGFAKWIGGWIKWFRLVIPFVRCHLSYPNSDKLRR